jgi:hypothetical protein
MQRPMDVHSTLVDDNILQKRSPVYGTLNRAEGTVNIEALQEKMNFWKDVVHPDYPDQDDVKNHLKWIERVAAYNSMQGGSKAAAVAAAYEIKHGIDSKDRLEHAEIWQKLADGKGKLHQR